MKKLIILAFLISPVLIFSQIKPAYCNDFPDEYSTRGAVKRDGRKALPKFSTRAVVEYKIQVAILRNTSPEDYPFHRSLVARYRPCEEVWVVESRNSFRSRTEANDLKNELIELGYQGAYITELVAFY